MVWMYVSRRRSSSLSEPSLAATFLKFGHVFLEKGFRSVGIDFSVSMSISFVEFFIHSLPQTLGKSSCSELQYTIISKEGLRYFLGSDFHISWFFHAWRFQTDPSRTLM